MPEATSYALPAAAVLTGVLHTLIPDHWLPFVLIGRARNWSPGMAASISGLSALIHSILSAALGLLALGIGLKSAELLGHTLERGGAVLLILFGVVYAMWAWRKGGHFHPGGALIHQREEREAACDGREGPGHPEHLHYHADGYLIRSQSRWSAVSLAMIVGANPCVLILPIVLATAPHGARAVALVTLAYCVPTILLMVGLTTLGIVGGRRIRLPGAARHMESSSGLLIALAGMLVWLR